MEISINIKVEQGKMVCHITVPKKNEFTKYAFYLYDSQNNLIEKREYSSNVAVSFLPEHSGRYFVKGFVKYKKSKLQEYETFSQKSEKVYFYKTKSICYEAWERESLVLTEPTIYEILWDGVKFEFLLNYRPKSKTAVVFGTGALTNYPRTLWPRFHRASWSEEISDNAIYYFDPTLYLGDITVGWGYGTEKQWYLEKISVLVKQILLKWNISMTNTLFFGSSAGGYTALVLAVLLRGKATVINPQLIISNYLPKYYEKFQAIIIPDGKSIQTYRLHLVKLIQKERFFPKIHIVQNILAKEDMQTQLLPFCTAISEANLDCGKDLEWLHISFYAKENGHNAMPEKEKCFQIIAEDIRG